MTRGLLFSSTEKKLLLALFFVVGCVFYAHCANNVIEIYNEGVRQAQFEKQYLANSAKTSMFSNCTFGPPAHVLFFWLQFFTNPVLFFVLRKPKFSSFLISTLINLLMALSLLAWNLRNYNLYILSEGFGSRHTSDGYFGLSSNLTAFVLAVLLLAFVILQFSILARFAVERFSTKLALE